MLDKEALIRDRAYAIWEASGRPFGREKEHWFQAMHEVTNETVAAANPVKRVRRVLRSATAPAKRKK